ncbi:Uncharacterised protein [uncultured Clostridium sp.]|uniref:hypothetical protein n=1 Tax=uncultured Clostridium sp. TaxID=59620 RepID=UPI00082145B2|nr:hypothetical protein [uncultured Clostridium sp.]SCK01424.1 Uncharacterised protein [uncultured Clostridium sp.]
MCNGISPAIVGIDKMKLVQFPIELVNIDKLYNKCNVSISESDLYRRDFIINEETVSLGSIVINDDIFKLIIGIKKINVNTFVPYQVLEVNPAAILYGSNIKNINDSSELSKAINIITERIYEYGIATDLYKAVIEEVEINTNIKLNDRFHNYRNVFELIKDSLPKVLNKRASYYDAESTAYTGFKVHNTQISLKFYDKFTEKGIISNESLLRIEYRLLNRNKVLSLFGFNTINDLLNNFNTVSIVFNNKIEKDIINKVTTEIRGLIKLNSKKLTDIKNTEYHYIKHFLAVTQDSIIFDYAIIESIINKLNISKSSKSKKKKELRYYLTERQKNGGRYFFNNIEKLNEIIISLGFKTIQI